MKKSVIIWMIAIGVILLVGIFVVLLHRKPFLGVGSFGESSIFRNGCVGASAQIDGYAETNGHLQGKLLDAVYKKNRIYIKFEGIDGAVNSFMIVPKELSSTIAKDYYKSGLNFLKFKYFYLSFCGPLNKFSTETILKNSRVIGDTQSMKSMVERYVESGETVLLNMEPGVSNIYFDKSGVLFLQKIFFL